MAAPLALVMAALIVVRIHPFLAVTQRAANANALVVEGWISDRSFAEVIKEIHNGLYEKIYTTGGPVRWTDASQYGGTYAGYCAMRLRNAGIDANRIIAVPSEDPDWERTYRSAEALDKYFQENHCTPRAINIVTVGPHARRTRLLYQRACGKRLRVGVIALPRDDYDPVHWWRTSTGLREVVSEAAAYVYCRIVPNAFAEP